MSNNPYYKSITYTIPQDYSADNFISINSRQLAGLYEPNVDIVEKLLEYSQFNEANDIISKIKLDLQK
jgi:hypothetical protein